MNKFSQEHWQWKFIPKEKNRNTHEPNECLHENHKSWTHRKHNFHHFTEKITLNRQRLSV